MRLATFNVLHGRSTSDGRVDLDRFAAAISSLDADVLALQEVDRAQERSGGADLTAIAARAMGAVSSHFAPALLGTPGNRWVAATGRDDAVGPAYGVSLLSRYPFAVREVVRLPALPFRVPFRPPGHRIVLTRDEPRVALVCSMNLGAGDVMVASTHLSFLPAWQLLQLRKVVRSLRGPRPRLLLGDLNMSAARAARVTGMQPLATGMTFPADSPREQIDHILGSGLGPRGSRSQHSQTRRLSISDHQALILDLD